jgi:hypothetical protein
MNYLEHIAIFGEKYELYLVSIIILLPFLLSLSVLFGSDDEDGINDNINKSETDEEVKLEKKENEITNINNNDLDVSNLFIFKNMKKLEIQNPDISIEIIEKEDKITKNINIKADEMNIEYQERK